MFVLKPNPTFLYPVSIPKPGDDAQTLNLIFKYRNIDELAKFTESFGEGKKARKDIDILMDMIEGWEDVDAPFSKENLEALIVNYPMAKKEILEAYFAAFYKGKEKN